MRLSDLVPSFLRGRQAVAAVVEDMPSIRDIKRELDHFRDRADTLESMLSSRGDPDSKLPGNQNASLFRALSGSGDDSNRDFDEHERGKQLQLCHEIYAHRGVAHNILEIFLDFVIGDGFKPVATDPKDTKLQALLDEIWKDQRNRLAEQHEGMARTLYLEGERFMEAQLSAIDGHLEFGYMPVEIVKRVIQDALGRDVFLELLPLTPGALPRRYFILDNLNDQVEIEVLPATNDEHAPRYAIYETIVGPEGGTPTSKRIAVHGLAFAWFENRPGGATRGRSDLLHAIDYIDVHDELLWNDVEVEKLKRLFILVVKSTDITTKASALAKLEEMGLSAAPKGPKVIAHNDNAEVQLLTSKAAAGSSELERTVRMNIYGSMGFPEHFGGSGADANLATAQAQEMIPMKRMRRKQDRLVERFHRLVEVSIELRKRAGTAKIESEKADFTIQRTEVGGKDKARGAILLKDIVVAIAQAVGDGIITKEAANAVVIQTIRDVGYKVDEEDAGVPEDDPNADVEKIQKLLMRGGGKGEDPKERVRGAA